MCAVQLVWNPDAHEATVPFASRYPSIFVLDMPVLHLKGIFECSDYDFVMSFKYYYYYYHHLSDGSCSAFFINFLNLSAQVL